MQSRRDKSTIISVCKKHHLSINEDEEEYKEHAHADRYEKETFHKWFAFFENHDSYEREQSVQEIIYCKYDHKVVQSVSGAIVCREIEDEK